jgi:ethanolamine utilization protein EutA (predicted chaperonin)
LRIAVQVGGRTEELKEEKFMAAAGAAAAAIANALKASGVVVRVSPADFYKILHKIEKPLVVYAEGGFFSTNYQYLVSYKGFAFFTRSSEPLLLPGEIETIVAKKIWIPG